MAFPGEAIILMMIAIALKVEICKSPSLFEFFQSLLSTGMQGRSLRKSLFTLTAAMDIFTT